MLYRIIGLKLKPDESDNKLTALAARELSVRPDQICSLRIYRKSLDARRDRVLYQYTVDVTLKTKPISVSEKVQIMEAEYGYSIPSLSVAGRRPVVVGFGPAGMFCALVLARAGLRPLVIERGRRVEDRVRDVERFFNLALLDEESNLCFGEGGAGTFSDGKLNTLLKDKNERGRFVLEELVKAGAPEEILYLNKPHVGTDRLRVAVKSIRQEIERLGGEVRFETKMFSLVSEKGALKAIKAEGRNGVEEIACDALFLAIGHSARDTFRCLREHGIPMEKKIFSVGVRIEHLQSSIDHAQLGDAREKYSLPAADYKLAVPTRTGKTLYTFCMCPGGRVVAATGTESSVVTNGMSFYARSEENANSALLLNVLPEELGEDLFAGFDFQERLEKKAFELGGGDYKAPCQCVGDLLKGEKSTVLGCVNPTYSRGVTPTDLSRLFPKDYVFAMQEGIELMGRKIRGFDAPDAVLTGVESRATCPVRILRGEDMQSSLRGVYPIGEGAGYAGGIMSSAMDGMKAAEAYMIGLENHL